MSSDSEDETIKKFLEAADLNLLNDSLFKRKEKSTSSEETTTVTETKSLEPENKASTPISISDEKLSQRYLHDDADISVDFQLPNSTQNFIAKKLSELIEQRFEFVPPAEGSTLATTKTKPSKSRVKLLADSTAYVKAFEEYEESRAQPLKRPAMPRRRVDSDDAELTEVHRLKAATISGQQIMEDSLTQHLVSKRKENPNKVFHYKMKTEHLLEYVEPETEFTALRRKNNWNANRIKFKKC